MEWIPIIFRPPIHWKIHTNPTSQSLFSPVPWTTGFEHRDAVQWFSHDILPSIRAGNPTAHFYIVGARPTEQVQALASLPGVHVTGTVPDVRPYLAHARVSVAPLRIARGIQNKVLEAMAMAKPVLVSPQCTLKAIDALPGRELMLVTTVPRNFAEIASHMLQQDNIFGTLAREKVEAIYGWDNTDLPWLQANYLDSNANPSKPS